MNQKLLALYGLKWNPLHRVRRSAWAGPAAACTVR